MPESADQPAGIRPTAGPAAADSVAGHFLAVAAGLAARLVGLGPALAEQLLRYWLGQSWWRLPAPFQARLRTACRAGGDSVQRALLRALAPPGDADATGPDPAAPGPGRGARTAAGGGG